MNTYLIGISYHEPEPYRNWLKGLIEEYLSATGILINANSEEDAIAWGEQIGQKLFQMENPKESFDWKSFEHFCWVEQNWKASGWNHCLDFFQTVDYGNYPDLKKMGTEAFVQWCEKISKA